MPVIPLDGRRGVLESWTEFPLLATAATQGTFRSPSGLIGSFSGSYRLQRFVSQFHQLAAVGIFSGELCDETGALIGLASRRNTVAVEAVAGQTPVVARVGPVDVNLLGFLVTVKEFTFEVHHVLGTSIDLCGAGPSDTRRPPPH